MKEGDEILNERIQARPAKCSQQEFHLLLPVSFEILFTLLCILGVLLVLFTAVQQLFTFFSSLCFDLTFSMRATVKDTNHKGSCSAAWKLEALSYDDLLAQWDTEDHPEQAQANAPDN